jgi:serine/threonine protein kinase
MNSILSGQSTSPTSSEVMNLRRELKVMGELRDAALQSLEALRGDVGDRVPNIDYAHLRVDAKIGSGSFAEVFRGEWTRPCAVKKLRGLTRRRQLQDFYREAQILSMVHHPGVVQLMGICMNIPELYLVTELVVGGSLEDVMHIEKRRLGHSEVLSIAVQIADAVQSLHIANVVHRDLKPSNCLIDHQGVVKLCDFGLARVTEKDPSQNSESSRAGTPVYLAPEALQGAPTTNKVDVYSYGIICWEMLTGLQAWVSLDYKQMVNAVLRCDSPARVYLGFRV